MSLLTGGLSLKGEGATGAVSPLFHRKAERDRNGVASLDAAKERAKVLAEALPYIREFSSKIFVIKYSGEHFIGADNLESISGDIALLKAVGIFPVLVHGGQIQITEMEKKQNHEPKFVRGMRVTDEATMSIVEDALGKLNKDISSGISRQGGNAVGLSGKDASLILAKPYNRESTHCCSQNGSKHNEMGFVGDVDQINASFIMGLLSQGIIPVIAPIGIDKNGKAYNINADLVAGAVAAALKAEKLILITSVSGVLDADGNLISTIHVGEVGALIRDGVVKAGMIPKLDCCLDALKGEVHKTHIIDGRIPHAVILEIFTDAGVGTEIFR